MDRIGIQLLSDFDKIFGKSLWSKSHSYIINEPDLIEVFRILNKHIFKNKLEEIPFLIQPFTGQYGKGSFMFGYIAQTNTYRQRIKMVYQIGSDNFFKIVCVLFHEMIHYYDFNYGTWSTFNDKGDLRTDRVALKQFVGTYDIHNNPLFERYMNQMNSYGFNIQKMYTSKDGIYMRKIDENNKKIKKINEDPDEDSINDKNIISDKYAKNLYKTIKSNTYKNIITKSDGSWMIEVE